MTQLLADSGGIGVLPLDLLDTGEAANRAELALYLQMSRAYVTQVLGPMVHAPEGEVPTRAPAATHRGDT